MKKKKLFKRIILFIVLIIMLLIALPFLLKDTIIKKAIEKVNNDYNINITYSAINLSLLKHFPSATLTINDLRIKTENTFETDTLVYASNVFLDINIVDAFKKNTEKITIKRLTFNQLDLNLLINKDGKVNYDIKKKAADEIDNSSNNENSSEDLTFEISKYNLINSAILFKDKTNDTYIKLDNIDHQGNGDFTASTTDLNTKTSIEAFTFKLDEVAYFNKAKINLNTVLGMDFNQNKYTFKENNLTINDLKLNFDGFVKLNENDIETDIKFNAPNTNFKSVLSLIPNAYSNSFKGVTATGIASVSGYAKGKSSDVSTPKYAIKIKTDNASFKYPDLTKEVTDINFDGAIINNSIKNNVGLDIKTLKFTIDKDTFETNGTVTNLTTNPTFDTSFKGTLNLDNLKQAYPVKFNEKITGILQADFTTKGDQKSVENNDFDKIKTNGNANLKNFSYAGSDTTNTIFIENANIKFSTNSISLTDFNAKTGKSDFRATGTLDNLYAFLLNDKDLKGRFNITSNNFVISDFLIDENNEETTKNSNTNKSETITESLKIPDFLDIKTTLNAKKVVYDDLVLNDVVTTMQLKNQKAILTNTKAKMLDGDISFNGILDTKVTPSTFDLDLIVNDFDIMQSFTKMETFQKIIPIAKSLNGKYDTAFKIKGSLNNDFSPNMNTINGNALAQLFVDDIKNNDNPLFQAISSNLSFIDIKKLKLDKLKTALTFQNGRVSVKPFDITYDDITMTISGNHGFDKSLQYNMKMDLPAKYLGNEAMNLLSKLTNVNKDTITIPLTALISGSVLKPTINANFKQAMTDLAIKVAKYQKEQLINQATDQVTEVIKDVISDNSAINDILEDVNILKPKDTTNAKPNTNEIINDAANGILNGIFGKKKKKKKDD